MGVVQGALGMWIYAYRGAPRRFIKEVFCIRGVHYGISCPRGSKILRFLNDLKHNFGLLNG